MAETIMKEKWKQWYRLGTRLLCPFCVAIVLVFPFDLIAPANEHDEVIVTQKGTYYNRSGTHYNISAKGRRTYREEVPSRIYQTAKEGDTLRVSLSPLLKKWRTIDVVRDGVVLVSGRGSELYWMGGCALLFLLSLAAFLPERVLFSNRPLVILLLLLNFIAIWLWVYFIRLWTGHT